MPDGQKYRKLLRNLMPQRSSRSRVPCVEGRRDMSPSVRVVQCGRRASNESGENLVVLNLRQNYVAA